VSETNETGGVRRRRDAGLPFSQSFLLRFTQALYRLSSGLENGNKPLKVKAVILG